MKESESLQNLARDAVRIGLIGDFNREVRAHEAVPTALEIASGAVETIVEPTWLPTASLNLVSDRQLAHYDGFWCIPGSPYVSTRGALRAIRFAREAGHPFLGTCGGFQHALIEYVRDFLGITDADHAESNPHALIPLITALSCPLVDKQGKIKLRADSHIASIYGADEVVEVYNCTFGFNPLYASLLDGGPLLVSGVDEAGEVRVVELVGHPFFIATLFQPELSAFDRVEHPLISSFLRAALLHSQTRTR